jgi:hypothetical protein
MLNEFSIVLCGSFVYVFKVFMAVHVKHRNCPAWHQDKGVEMGVVLKELRSDVEVTKKAVAFSPEMSVISFVRYSEDCSEVSVYLRIR